MELLVSKSLYKKLDRIQNSIMDTAEDVLYGLVRWQRGPTLSVRN